MCDSQNAETVFLVSRKQSESQGRECRAELLAIETVLPRMDDKTSKKEIGVKGRVNLFKVEEPVLNKNSRDFPNPFFPVLQMMDDAEIKDCIHAGVRVGKFLGIGNEKKGKPPCTAVDSFLCEPDHQGIDINTIHPA